MSNAYRAKEILEKNQEYSRIISEESFKINEINKSENLDRYKFLGEFNNKLTFLRTVLCKRDIFISSKIINNKIDINDIINETLFERIADKRVLFELIRETSQNYVNYINKGFPEILKENNIMGELLNNFIDIQKIFDEIHKEGHWIWYNTEYESFCFLIHTR